MASLNSRDVPQSDSLDRIRRVVAAVSQGAGAAAEIAAATSISLRHVHYALNSARVLGWVREAHGAWAATTTGTELLARPPDTKTEREWLARSLEASKVVQKIAPGLLGPDEPSLKSLAQRIHRLSGLAPDTAKRRAQTLLAWRRDILAPSEDQIEFSWPQVALPDALVRDLQRDNPWWQRQPSKLLPPHKRELVGAIHRRLRYKLAPIIVVRGPRQVGKTTAQLQVITDLLNSGVPATNILRVQCDDLPALSGLDEPILRIIDWYEQQILRSTLNAAATQGRATYIFLDEVQNLEDWPIQLKHLVDNSTTQLVVTGSSALRIEAGRDSLAGRINTIEVGTLTVREIAAIRGMGRIEPALKDNGLEPLTSFDFWHSVRDSGIAQRALRDAAFAAFSERGGYPLVHERRDVPWSEVADQLNETVIRRVIQHDLRIGDRGRKRDPALLEELFRLACRYAGQTPGLDMLAREVQRALHANVGTQRVRHYLDFLHRTLLIRVIPPMEIRLKKTRGQAKLCLADHGLRASWLQELVPLEPGALARHSEMSDLAGRIAESVVGSYLSTISGLDIAHFPQRSGEPEVDFVLTVGATRVPIEVKYRRSIDPQSDTEGLRSFIEKAHYRASFGILITQDERPVVRDPRIVVVPLSSFLIMR